MPRTAAEPIRASMALYRKKSPEARWPGARSRYPGSAPVDRIMQQFQGWRRVPVPSRPARWSSPQPATLRGDQIRSRRMSRLLCAVLLMVGTAACAAPRAAGAPLAPLGSSWVVPTLGLYQEWWDKTVACSGKLGKMTDVTFYAVDAPPGGHLCPGLSCGVRSGLARLQPRG